MDIGTYDVRSTLKDDAAQEMHLGIGQAVCSFSALESVSKGIFVFGESGPFYCSIKETL